MCQCNSPVLRNACFADTGHPKIALQALAGSAHWKQRVSSRNCFQQKYVFLWGECCWQAPELIEHMLPILSWNCHPLTIKVPKKVEGTCKGVGHPSYQNYVVSERREEVVSFAYNIIHHSVARFADLRILHWEAQSKKVDCVTVRFLTDYNARCETAEQIYCLDSMWKIWGQHTNMFSTLTVCRSFVLSNEATVAEFIMVCWIDQTRRMGVGISSRPSTHGRGKPLPTTDPGHHRQRAGRRRYRADTEHRQVGDTGSDVPVETSQSPDGRLPAHLFLFHSWRIFHEFKLLMAFLVTTVTVFVSCLTAPKRLHVFVFVLLINVS